jgi:hypothetical protein
VQSSAGHRVIPIFIGGCILPQKSADSNQVFFKAGEEGLVGVRVLVAEFRNLSYDIGAGFIGGIMQQLGGANLSGRQRFLRALDYLESGRDLSFDCDKSLQTCGVTESHHPTISETGARIKQ